MWLNRKTILKPKSVNSLVFVVIYCLIFILPNVCHGDSNFTSNVPRSDTNSPKNKTHLLLSKSPQLTEITTTAETTVATTIGTTTKIPLTKPSKEAPTVAKEAPTEQSSSIIKKLPTIRTNATTNNVKIINDSTEQRTSTSTTLNTEKLDISRISKSKPKQKQALSLSQQQPQYKVSSWPSKPSGTGNF